MSIEKEDIDRLDERYVRKDDCNEMRTETDKRIEEMKTDVAIMKSKLNTLIGILTTIAVPVLAIAVKYLFGGI